MTFKDGNPGVTKSGRMAVWHQIKGAPNHCGWRYLDDTNVPDGVEVRPLVMIDPEDAFDAVFLLDHMRAALMLADRGDMLARLQRALREYVTPKPPKPDEPTGRLAVVVDDDGVEWVRDRVIPTRPWNTETDLTEATHRRAWDDIPVTSPDQIKFAGLQ